MQHLEPYRRRDIRHLEQVDCNGWRLKRYAIIADGRAFDPLVVEAATAAALERLPKAGTLTDGQDNHGIGVQIFHFAEQIPLVSPVFYWKWGSVLFNAHQVRSYSTSPYKIVDGVREVVGCIWEMELVSFEVQAWRNIVLGGDADPNDRVERYLNASAAPNGLPQPLGA